ncbi:hypothetical protein Plhal304r1_c007g0027261 [Plasmopara halstedii]
MKSCIFIARNDIAIAIFLIVVTAVTWLLPCHITIALGDDMGSQPPRLLFHIATSGQGH